MNWLQRLEKGSARERKVFIASLVAAVLMLIADQWTKWYFVCKFKQGASVEVIPGYFNLTYVHNFGAAWSIFSGYTWFLLLLGIAAGASVIVFFRKLAENCAERYFALMLLVSGIIGNSFDRAFHGSVVDFIHVHYKDVWHYPIFNVADIAICTGVGIYVLSNCLRKSPEGKK